MSDVRKENGANFIRDRTERLKVDRARVGGRAALNHLWRMLLRQITHLVVVNSLIVLGHAIRNDREVLA